MKFPRHALYGVSCCFVQKKPAACIRARGTFGVRSGTLLESVLAPSDLHTVVPNGAPSLNRVHAPLLCELFQIFWGLASVQLLQGRDAPMKAGPCTVSRYLCSVGKVQNQNPKA